MRPVDTVSIDVATFYHDYDNIRSVEPLGAGPTPIVIRNGLKATTYGGAINVKWRVTHWWELEGNATYLQSDFDREPGSRDTSNGRSEGNDPDSSFAIRSALDLPWNLKFDTMVRYVAELPDPATPSHTQLDLRLAWSPVAGLEVAVVGRNLLDDSHPEFRGRIITREVQRSVFGTFRWQF